jgi:hypothetical protein
MAKRRADRRDGGVGDLRRRAIHSRVRVALAGFTAESTGLDLASILKTNPDETA